MLVAALVSLTLAAAPAYCTGQPVSDSSGPLYPNGQRVVDGFGKEYYDRLPGGETAFYQLDVVAGVIDLRNIRYEFPVGSAIITVAADLAAGRLDRGSIAAVCLSGR